MPSARTIKRARAELGLTQEAFAKLLNVTRDTVAKWEAGGNMSGSAAELFRRVLDEHRNKTAALGAEVVEGAGRS